MPVKIPMHLPAVLMLGLVSQVGQVLLLRELLMVFHGNELSIGIILSAWLAWVGVGSRLGAWFAERRSGTLSLLVSSAGGILVLLPVTIFIIRILRGFFDLVPGAYLSLTEILLSCFALMGPVCLLLGAHFVLLSKLWRERDQALDTSGAGKTYVVEAAGHMLGGILFTFLLVHTLNSFQIASLAGALMLVFILLNLQAFKNAPIHRLRYLIPLVVFLPLVAAGAFFLLERLDHWGHELQWQYTAPEHELVDTYQSKHGDIAVLKRQDQYSFFQSGHLMFSTAGPETMVPGLEGQEAVSFAHLAMLQHHSPDRVLLLGGGLRGTLAEILKHPVQRVDYIELDEVLTQAAKPYVFAGTLEALEDPRVNLLHKDARLFVKTAQEKYDLIIVDAPDPSTAVFNRYYTQEFFQEAKDLLPPDGSLVTGAVSTPDLRGTAIANRNATIYHTLDQVFTRVLPAGDRFMFLFASNHPKQVSVDPRVLQERYQERDIHSPGFSPHHLHVLLEDSQLRRVNQVVRHHGRGLEDHLTGPTAMPLFPAPVEEQILHQDLLPQVNERYFINTDFRPIGYYYTLMFWDQLTRHEKQDTLKGFLHVQPWWILPVIGACLLGSLVLRAVSRLTHTRMDISFAVLGTAFTTGLSTMAMQVALLFSFQSVYGFIYETVGLITALFMVGLALGALVSHHYLAHRTDLRLLAWVQAIMAFLAGFMALILPLAAGVQSTTAIFGLFSGLTFAAGIINGINFPLAAACCLNLSRRAEQSTGRIYGAELIGACLGAALASALVAPILGIVACFLLAAAANATAFMILMLSRRSYV